MNEVICRHCRKQVNQISEYIEMAREENTTPSEYARDYDGTYLEESNSVLCTDCYIELECPNKESKAFFSNIMQQAE